MLNIKAIALKEVIQILRDKRMLMMVILMPFFQVMIYGFGINTDVKHLRTYVYDQDRTYLSRRLIAAFEHSEYFKIIKTADNVQTLRHGLDKGKAQAGLV